MYFFLVGILPGCRVGFDVFSLDSTNVGVLVKSVYILFASTIGMWFIKCEGSPFLYLSIGRLIFHDVGICCCL